MQLELGITQEERKALQPFIDENKIESELSEDGMDILLAVMEMDSVKGDYDIAYIGKADLFKTIAHTADVIVECSDDQEESRSMLYAIAGRLRRIVRYVESKAENIEPCGFAESASFGPMEEGEIEDVAAKGESDDAAATG